LNTNTERSNFLHLVADIAWFGLAMASTSRFLSIYAIRLGATPFELGLIAALPGLALLFSTGMSIWWRRRYRNSVRALLWPAFGFRLAFLLPALAPLFPPEWQVAWLIAAATLPAIPQGVAGAIFIVLMRESVNDALLTRLQSRRQLALNVTVAISAVAFGVLLEAVPFPTNYQIMFVLAFVFTMFSQWHVTRVREMFPAPVVAAMVQQPVTRIWKSVDFQMVGNLTFFMHLAFFSVIAVVPLYLVEHMGASESYVAMFGMVELAAGALMASLADRLIRRVGSRTLIALAMLGTALAPIIIAFAPSLELALVAGAISGAAWTLASISIFSLLIERVHAEDMPRATVAFQQLVALAIFIGPLIGSTLTQNRVNIVMVLMLGASLRLIAAVVARADVLQRPFHARGQLNRAAR
jgi:MFS family permease